MKPENKVLSIINEEINLFETDISGHAFDQMRKRLDRMKSGGDITPEEDAEIRKNLNSILTHEFDSKDYGIFLGAFKPNPKSPLYTITNPYDPGIPFYQIFSDDGVFAKDSTGDEMWAIIRNNVLKTVMLRKSVQRRSMNKERNVDGGLGVDIAIPNLEKFLANEKQKKELFQQKMLQRQQEEKSTINVDGVIWAIDTKNQKLYKKNNPNVFVTFDNILNHPAWNENTQEKVFNYVTDYLDTLK